MVSTDPHAGKNQLDDPHDNPRYDTDGNGFVDQLDDDVPIGPNDRPLFSTGNRTINVPGDMGLQAALQELPLFLDDLFTIDVAAGDYTNTDVYIPPFTGWKDYDAGERGGVEIKGSPAAPADTKLGSVIGFNPHSHKPVQIYGFQLEGGSPFDDERPAIGAYAGGEVEVHDCKLNNSRGDMGFGFVAYGGDLNAYAIDLGNKVMQEDAFLVKGSGSVYLQTAAGNAYNDIIGTATKYLLSGAGQVIFEDVAATGASGTSDNRGLHLNRDTGAVYGIESMDGLTVGDLTVNGSVDVSAAVFSSDLTVGDPGSSGVSSSVVFTSDGFGNPELYAVDGELYAKDGAGNTTKIS